MTDLVKYDDPILYKPVVPFNFDLIDPRVAADELINGMLKYGGVGLSSNQIGRAYSAFAIILKGSPVVIFNPRIQHTKDDMMVSTEGCLTFPGLVTSIKRHKTIYVTYETMDRSMSVEKLDDMSSIIFQHEMMHMRGLPYFYGISKFKLKRAMEICKKKIGRDYSPYLKQYNPIEDQEIIINTEQQLAS